MLVHCIGNGSNRRVALFESNINHEQRFIHNVNPSFNMCIRDSNPKKVYNTYTISFYQACVLDAPSQSALDRFVVVTPVSSLGVFLTNVDQKAGFPSHVTIENFNSPGRLFYDPGTRLSLVDPFCFNWMLAYPQ